MMLSQPTPKPILWLEQVTTDLTSLVGGKGANLGQLLHGGFPVPTGFVVTTSAFKKTLETNNLTDAIHTIEANIDHSDLETLEIKARNIQTLILNTKIPFDLLSC
jgi:phosphoenolpyruvate synthase/pyruvate phosphate dikinase